MGKRVLRTQYVLWALGLVPLVACMPKVESEEEAEVTVTFESHAIVGSGPSTKIVLTGKCPHSTQILKIMIDGDEHSNVNRSSSPVTDGSGVPVGKCENGNLEVQFPIPNYKIAKNFEFKIKVQILSGQITPSWASRVVTYAPAVQPIAGAAVLSGGGKSTGTGVVLYGAIGESAGNTLLTGPGVSVKAGITGVLQE